MTLFNLVLAIALAASTTSAQTSSFTYQGRLTDGGSAATGNYDFQFALWDSLSGGAQMGSTVTLSTVAVSNGVFTVALDFGASSFNGGSRFLEISARPASGGAFTLLSPRQPVTAIPYSIRSLNAAAADTATTATNTTQLGGIAAINYVQTNDSRLTDARPPTAGSPNYVQNATSLQTNTNLNISGNGTVGGTLSGNVVAAMTHFNIGPNPVLSVTGDSLFVGMQAGQSNTGNNNAFFGNSAGGVNTSGSQNSFFGTNAGFINSAGRANTLIGFQAGGGSNPTGDNNTMVGANTGATFGTNHSTLVGEDAAALSVSSLTNATAIGANAMVSQSNSLVLGSINGANNANADTNVGIGTAAPRSGLEVKRNWDGAFGALTVTGDRPTIRFSAADSTAANQQWILHLGSVAGTSPAGSLSFFNGGTGGTSYGNPVLSVTPSNTVIVGTLASAGGTQLCRNGSNEISTCSSSLRYKTNIAPFSGGMNIIKGLRPISFEWKQNRVKDIGLGAEEVVKVEPLLTFRNDSGEIEGVKYNQLSAVFINAFKEQQAEIEALRRANLSLNARLKNLEGRRRNRIDFRHGRGRKLAPGNF